MKYLFGIDCSSKALSYNIHELEACILVGFAPRSMNSVNDKPFI